MNKLRILGTTAVMALLVPLVSADPGFAQGRGGGDSVRISGGGNSVRISGSGGNVRISGSGPRNRGGNWRGSAVLSGLAAGALIGGAYANPYYDNTYYNNGYYNNGYYNPPSVEVPYSVVVPSGYDGSGDATAYCAQRFQSYDPASGTYMGYDGIRRPCP